MSAPGRKRTSLREGTLAQVVKSTPHPKLASPEAHAWHAAKSGSTSACQPDPAVLTSSRIKGIAYRTVRC